MFAGAGQGLDGVVSIFRGLYRFSRHQSRLHGNHGPGQQVQAATIEHMLLGEALQLALYANRAIIEKGGEALEGQSTLLIVRQATAIYLGSKVAGGTTAGPSISILAGMGDIYHNIEQLAVAGKLFINTVNPNSPILPQLPQEARDQLAAELQRFVEIGLTGR